MKFTQKEIIVKYLESIPSEWIKSYQLRGKDTPFGFAGHQADRRARELAEAGQIDVRHTGKYAEYRCKHVQLPISGVVRSVGDIVRFLEKKERPLQESLGF